MALGRRRRKEPEETPADQPHDEATRPSAAGGSLLGMLRSELDDDATLPPLFDEVYDRTGEIRTAVQDGKLARAAAARELSGLRISAPDGTRWAAGASSLTWYRKLPGGTWVRHVPPLGDEQTPYQLLDPVDPDTAEGEPTSVAERLLRRERASKGRPAQDHGAPDAQTADAAADAGSEPAAPAEQLPHDGGDMGDAPAHDDDAPATPAYEDHDEDYDGGGLSLDHLAELARDLDEGEADGAMTGLEHLPELPDDPDRDPGGTHGKVDIPRLVEPGHSVSDTDDALGEAGRLSDEELSELSGQGGGGYGEAQPSKKEQPDWMTVEDDQDDEDDILGEFGYGD